MPSLLDSLMGWLTGKTRNRQAEEAAAEAQAASRSLQHKAQDRVVAGPAAAPPPVERVPEMPRPSERWKPEKATRMQALHDTPPQPAPDPSKTDDGSPAQVATRMENTLTAQAPPSPGGPGTRWVNPRAGAPRQTPQTETSAAMQPVEPLDGAAAPVPSSAGQTSTAELMLARMEAAGEKVSRIRALLNPKMEEIPTGPDLKPGPKQDV